MFDGGGKLEGIRKAKGMARAKPGCPFCYCMRDFHHPDVSAVLQCRFIAFDELRLIMEHRLDEHFGHRDD